MTIGKDILNSVAERCKDVVQLAESMHLASIAKAIEYKRPCQIFMEGFEKKLFKELPCFTANVEPFMAFKMKDHKEFLFIQHFIFYKRDEDPSVERLRIAHELGHCALHWPLVGDRINRRICGDLPEVGRCYILDFNEKEEKEADAFACLLGVHRPKPMRSSRIYVNEDVYRMVEECQKRGILYSTKSKT